VALVAWAAASCASSTACPFGTVQPPPGTLLGAFSMHAEPASLEPPVAECELDEVVPAAFDFDLALSMDEDAGQPYVTLSAGYSRLATWDGQVVRSRADARRYFEQCSECVTRVQEDIDVALLSRSQSAAVGNGCPANPLDGGVPPPDDAGIEAPGQRPEGFDALLACGELRTEVLVDQGLPDGGPCPSICAACRTFYLLRGERR